MKRLFAIALALIALSCAVCFADSEAETNAVVYDFGDFTLELPEDIAGESGEIIENQAFLILYPDYDAANAFFNNIICVWTSEIMPISGMKDDDCAAYANSHLSAVAAQYKAQGLITSDFDIIACQRADVAGKDAIMIHYSSLINYANIGLDVEATVYTYQLAASDAALGTYIFTFTYYDPADIEVFSLIMDTLKWK